MSLRFFQRGRVEEVDGTMKDRAGSHNTNGLPLGGEVAFEVIAHTHGR